MPRSYTGFRGAGLKDLLDIVFDKGVEVAMTDRLEGLVFRKLDG